MNKLSYGLLSLLSTEPMTGYDLTAKINRFWRSTHSAIYPLLSELEEKELVALTLVKQSGKPDKKIYNLTIQGKSTLHQWFISDTDEAVVRDEMTLKLYCIKCMDVDAAEKLLDELEAKYIKRIDHYKGSIEKLRLMSSDTLKNTTSSLFGGYILTQRVLNEAKLGLKWCHWVRKIYKLEDLSFLDVDFN
ncbi:PadR family transcriptional regulator [Clostridium sp. YIM B02505]|uniref:PadR family transcriptional regulator n=1 Tax=Clostridium yunnanense TaxID=2800325 RepID=A0ABS1ETV1_9CLOT|nr:PadR family transcriptional regulator [Clostridium yunnanense]MBK1812814.1 PadR family transcriptional regulator [Clostridium yunnanense]